MLQTYQKFKKTVQKKFNLKMKIKQPYDINKHSKSKNVLKTKNKMLINVPQHAKNKIL